MMENIRRIIHCSEWATVLLVMVPFLIQTGCGEATTEEKAAVNNTANGHGAVSTNIVARVNDVEITSDHVRELINSADTELSPEAALEILVKNELLAAEAKARGFNNSPEFLDAKKVELVRAYLKKQIGLNVNTATLDENKLRNLYEANAEKFVHGTMRRVKHILVFTGDVGLPDDEAKEIADEIADEAKQVANETQFVDMYNSIRKKYPPKLKLESLSPFTETSKKYVKEFVDGTFALSAVGSTSRPVKTSFGYHVIFVAEELPPMNRSFEEAREELAEGVLPVEKEIKYEELMETLTKQGEVFVFQDALEQREHTK